MDRIKTEEIFKAFGKPIVKVANTVLAFARQNEKNLDEIEAMADDKLIAEWKSLVFINDIVGQVSLNDMQRIFLLELEMNDRPKINSEELKSWYDLQVLSYEEH